MDIPILDIVDKVNLLARVEVLLGMLWFRRQGHEIRVSRIGPMSGVECARELRRVGIRTWGGRATTKWFHLYVSRQQAKFAESVLLGKGCSLDKITAGARATRVQRSWGEKQSRRMP
jgi:hypothetical protein